MTANGQQRRGRSIAMSPQELDGFLAEQRTLRLATLSLDGRAHLSPVWFVPHRNSLWVSSLVRSQRWADIQRQPSVTVLVDSGEQYEELRGAELRCRAVPVGEIPRLGETVPELIEVELSYAQKYAGTDVMSHDGRHAWLRLEVESSVSWDFRKLPIQ